MSLIVQKYGGTSVGSPEKIKAVAARVLEYSRKGHEMVIVPIPASGNVSGSGSSDGLASAPRSRSNARSRPSSAARKLSSVIRNQSPSSRIAGV